MNDTESQSYLTDVRSRLLIHLNGRSEELPPIRWQSHGVARQQTNRRFDAKVEGTGRLL